MYQDHTRGTRFENSIHYRTVSVLLLIWYLAFMYPVVSITDTYAQLKAANAITEQGSLYNQLLIGAFALLGIVNLPAARRLFSVPQAKLLFFILGLYLTWCALSIFWSLDPFLSARRLVSLMLILVGCIGTGAGFYGRARNGIALLARHVMYSATICAVLLSVRIARGTHDITDPRFTLKYTSQIEPYAHALGFGVVAIVYLYQNQSVKKVFLGVTYFAMLIILKGRTEILGVLSAAGIVYSKLSSALILRTLIITVSFAMSALLLDFATGGAVLTYVVLSGYDALGAWMPYITIGYGVQNIIMLSGRIPLWRALIPYVVQNPFFGYGFGAFWSGNRFSEIYAAVRWHAVVAHNGFLEEILATGIIGLTFLLAFWGYGMYLAWRLGRSGYVVFAWMLLFLYFNTMFTIIGSYAQYPTFISIIAVTLVALEYSVQRCEDCGVMLIDEWTTESGELVLVHP